MKIKILLLITFFFSIALGYGQVANYSFSQASGSYAAFTGVQNGSWDDFVTGNIIPIGFSFNFNGINYTTCSVNSNGYITFGTTTSSNINYSPISSTAGYDGSISALGMDLGGTSEIVYSTIGTAPNRVFVLQWTNARRYNSNWTNGDFDFQIRLNESTNVVQVVYGPCATTYTTDLTAQIGLRGSTNADFNNRAVTNNWSSSAPGTSNLATCRTGSGSGELPGNGLTYTWTPKPIITSFTPNNVCAATGVSVVITGTNFTGATAVNFNGVPAAYTVNSNTQITAQLPATATTGAITVITPSGTATSTGTFTVNAPAGNQTSYGSDSWIGYVYANTNGGDPPTNAFTTNYVGYISQPETFDLNLVDGSLSGGNLCSTYADYFAIRFKMNKNLTAGYYTFNVGADDGYRLSLDGGLTYVINNWDAHPYESTTSNTVYLSGSTNFILEYFENAGQSRVGFSYTFCASSTAPTSITGLNSLCLGDTTTLTASGGVLAINSVYQWGTGATVGSNIIAGQTAASLVINPTATTTYWVRILDCTSRPTTGVTKTVTVNPVISGNTITGNQSICSGSTPTALTGSTPTGGNGTYVYAWESSTTSATAGFISAAGTNNTQNYISGVLSQTTWFRRTVTSGGCSNIATPIQVTINSLPSAPVPATPTQPDCVTAGSVVLSGLPATGTWNLYQNGNATPIVNGETGTTYTVSGLAAGNYTFTVSNGTCTSVASANVGIIAPITITATWDGSLWSPSAPTSVDNIIFAGNYTSSVNLAGEILEGCTCTVDAGVKVVFDPTPTKPNPTLKITNGVFVDSGQNASLTFENNASLVQVNDNDTNTGDITYKRTANTVNRSDYTYWSSPVKGQQLKDVSLSYTSGKFYSFNTTNWVSEATSNVMEVGKGYIIRGPQSNFPPASYDASFKGIPNNGPPVSPVLIGAALTSNLIGNPYPCALDADAFLNANSTVLEGTIYFWTHNTAIRLKTGAANEGSGDYVYISDDYAAYNRVGGLATATSALSDPNHSVAGVDSGVKPSGKIAAGQSFFATSKAAGTATFNNRMRVDNSGNTLDNSLFFKINTTKAKSASAVEKNRIWLNLTNSQGAFKQTLVGYVTGATNGYDDRFDGESFDGNTFIDFYSVNQDKNLAIQGRALPFDEADAVPLGYKTTIVGDFTIAVDQTDGFFTTQNVFIEDKLLNTTHDLKKAPYTFSTVKGVFNDRFVLRYTNKTLGTLGTQDFTTQQNQVLVSNKNKQIKINSDVETIDKVQVYDLLGKQIYQKTNVGSNELAITDLVSSHQVLVVKTVLQNGQTVIRKIIF